MYGTRRKFQVPAGDPLRGTHGPVRSKEGQTSRSLLPDQLNQICDDTEALLHSKVKSDQGSICVRDRFQFSMEVSQLGAETQEVVELLVTLRTLEVL